ncbi:MAG: hypothetical protein F6K15_17225 [Okeania sp. SIO2B3]|nr:hypothetical protein [Okeania sp. SIO2B3]
MMIYCKITGNRQQATGNSRKSIFGYGSSAVYIKHQLVPCCIIPVQ